MHVAPQQSARPLHHGVAEVHNQTARLRTHPEPCARVLGRAVGREDLKPAEHVGQQRYGAKVGVVDHVGAGPVGVGVGTGERFDHADHGAGGLGRRLQGREGVGRETELCGQGLVDGLYDALAVVEERGQE